MKPASVFREAEVQYFFLRIKEKRNSLKPGPNQPTNHLLVKPARYHHLDLSISLDYRLVWCVPPVSMRVPHADERWAPVTVQKGDPAGRTCSTDFSTASTFFFLPSFILLGLVCMPFMDVWRWRSNSLSYSFHTGHRRVSSQLTESKNAPNERWFRKIRSLRCHIWIRSTLNIFSFSYSPSPSSFFSNSIHFRQQPFSARKWNGLVDSTLDFS